PPRAAPAAAAVTGLLPWLAGAVGPLADALDRTRPAAGAGVPVHGDLSLDQLVQAPSGELWLVDGDAARLGTPEDDLGSLAAALVRAHDDVAAAADRLAVVLDGYGAAGAPGLDATALRRATAEHLLRRAAEPFRRREAGWAATTERLVALADEVARGRGRELGVVLDRRATRPAASAPAGAPPASPATPGRAQPDLPTGQVPASPRVSGPVRPAEGIRFAPVALALADRLAEDGGRLRAVVPRPGGPLLVVGADREGALVAGRWDEDRAAARYAHRVGAEPARVAAGGLVLLPGGHDPDLPGLGERLRPGAVLVAHRAGRRAVVRDPAGTYTKVTRPGREPADVAVPAGAFATPVVVDHAPGRVTTAPLPGRTLHDLLGDPTVSQPALDAVGHAVGRELRRLQEPAGPTGQVPGDVDGPAAGHGVDAEVAVVRRWWQLAAAHGATDDATAAAVVDHVARALAAVAPRPAVPAHRDLHDKQLLADPGAPDRVGLLDLDLATTAHPGLDLANLLVHLELRVLQGLCGPRRAASVARAVVAGYATVDARAASWLPDAGDVTSWATAARARLAAVYAFRPAPGDVPGLLLAGLARPLTLPDVAPGGPLRPDRTDRTDRTADRPDQEDR
ncbi:hypothetical protein ABE437_11765, partial [Isoptericola cucumis]|uniref:hypothetical protein n=1 Tax=Isoptericola cucumis TaxID=1776856 RepID=UPI0032081C90